MYMCRKFFQFLKSRVRVFFALLMYDWQVLSYPFMVFVIVIVFVFLFVCWQNCELAKSQQKWTHWSLQFGGTSTIFLFCVFSYAEWRVGCPSGVSTWEDWNDPSASLLSVATTKLWEDAGNIVLNAIFLSTHKTLVRLNWYDSGW